MEKYVLITGLMGSGKSTLIREFILHNEIAEFSPPPVDAKFRGMDFQFIDDIFALENGDYKVNFYELDAPTISKWTQFIQVADAIVIVYNFKKNKYFEDPQRFIQSIKTHARDQIPLYFILNNCNDEKMGIKSLDKLFSIKAIEDHPVEIVPVPEGKEYHSKKYGKRIEVDVKRVEDLFTTVVQQLS